MSQLLNILHKAGTVTLDGAGYTYDNAGNRTARTNYLNNITEQYTYDPLYQLTQVTQGTTTTESYSYDAVGNRLSSLNMSPYAYNSSNELTSTPNATLTYDANGNTLTKTNASGTTQYAWDFENRLITVTLPGSSGIVMFKYDAFGRRIEKNSSSGTTDYLYDGVNIVQELDASGTSLARYTQSQAIDEPLAELQSGTTSYYQQDSINSVTSLSNLTGALSNSYTYDAFGNLLLTTGSLMNSFQYTGRDFDPETRVGFYRARYYSPDTGRFISEDPIRFRATVNFYPYVLNSPINWRDPDGRKAGAGSLYHGYEKVRDWMNWISCSIRTKYCLQGLSDNLPPIKNDPNLMNDTPGLDNPSVGLRQLRKLCSSDENCRQLFCSCMQVGTELTLIPIRPPNWMIDLWGQDFCKKGKK
jgi:RHS repeat-associated protein